MDDSVLEKGGQGLKNDDPHEVRFGHWKIIYAVPLSQKVCTQTTMNFDTVTHFGIEIIPPFLCTREQGSAPNLQ